MKGIVGVASNLLHDKVMEAWQDSSEVRLIVYFIYPTEASLFRLLEHDARAYVRGGGGAVWVASHIPLKDSTQLV